ncbi:MAG: sigma factor, partial [Streptosporangiaceae bacterium]
MTGAAAPPSGTGAAAFERFFRAHYPAVVRIARGVVGDAAAAQDVAQDVFIAALARFPDPEAAQHAAAWVRVAAAHAGLNAIRGERRRDHRQVLSGIDVAPPGPEEAAL